jgi:hypothetical protein
MLLKIIKKKEKFLKKRKRLDLDVEATTNFVNIINSSLICLLVVCFGRVDLIYFFVLFYF